MVDSDDILSTSVKLSACQRCHSKKIRCSGEVPACLSCQKSGASDQCSYPSRDRRVKVKESYLRQLIAENTRLRALRDHRSAPCRSQIVNTNTTTTEEEENIVGEDPNDTLTRPVLIPGAPLHSQPWFADIDLSQAPTPINDATDTAFATRFRQAISLPHDPPCFVPPHVDFLGDDDIMSLADARTPWPRPARARMLIDVAFMHASRGYHIVRRSGVLHALEQSVSNPNWRDPVMECKLRALFAIGELCSSKFVAPGQTFPGLSHFAQATKILNYLGEWPTLDLIEIRLILSVFSFTLNRVHSAYTLAGSALRMAFILGLHVNIPASQLPDPAEREHRNRVFWTAFILDRLWACKLGCPIQDGDIYLDFPSNLPLAAGGTIAGAPPDPDDFVEACYVTACVNLTMIMNNVVRSIYGNLKDKITTIFDKVQKRVLELKNWVEELPQEFRISTSFNSSAYHRYDILSLHMTLNQTIILATRPILLYGLRLHMQSPPKAIPPAAETLIDTCVTCARHTCRLLSSSWINGAFPALYHDLTQYLFSAMTVLAVSSLFGHKESVSDREWFEESVQLLEQLKDSGNYPAREFHRHVKLIIAAMEKVEGRGTGVASVPTARSQTATGVEFPTSGTNHTTRAQQVRYGATTPAIGLAGGGASAGVAETAETALAEPSLQQFLLQSTIDMQFPDSTFDLFSEDNGLYWPEFDFQPQ